MCFLCFREFMILHTQYLLTVPLWTAPPLLWRHPPHSQWTTLPVCWPLPRLAAASTAEGERPNYQRYHMFLASGLILKTSKPNRSFGGHLRCCTRLPSVKIRQQHIATNSEEEGNLRSFKSTSILSSVLALLDSNKSCLAPSSSSESVLSSLSVLPELGTKERAEICNAARQHWPFCLQGCSISTWLIFSKNNFWLQWFSLLFLFCISFQPLKVEAKVTDLRCFFSFNISS